MIKIDENSIQYGGRGDQLIVELGVILRKFYQKGILDDDAIKILWALAKKSDEEIHAETEKDRIEMLKTLSMIDGHLDLLMKILKEKEDEGK